MTTWIKILILFGSLISIAFGIWHLFVPNAWNWYSYIDPAATELVLAVRAINLLFSLSLVLFGVANLLVVFMAPHERFSLLVISTPAAIYNTKMCIYKTGIVTCKKQATLATSSGSPALGINAMPDIMRSFTNGVILLMSIDSEILVFTAPGIIAL
jgi:hypothetical protein